MSDYNVLRVLCIVTTIIVSCHSSRILQLWINPDCMDLCKDTNTTTVYVRSEGANDTLHYIWDFSGKPSVLLAVTSPKAKLEIDWEPFLYGKENSVRFTETPSSTFGIVVLRVYEFNDANDTAQISDVNDKNINVLHTEQFQWNRVDFGERANYVEVSMDGTNYQYGQDKRNGSMKFLVDAFNSLDHSDIMPHLLHSENATQIDLVLDHFGTNSSFNSSRFAVELLIISNYKTGPKLNIDVKKTLDDEHTPGIFEMVELKPLASDENNDNLISNENSGYLQWRPVSYINPRRDVTSSTEATYYLLTDVQNHVETARNSLLYSFYGYELNNYHLQKINISFGSKGDGFYKKNNYSSWTFVIGHGTIPDERFSFLVIMIIAIGLGIPTIILLAAGVYMFARRRHQDAVNHSING